MGKGLPPVEFLGSTSELSMHLEAGSSSTLNVDPLVEVVLKLLRGTSYSGHLGLNPSSATDSLCDFE